MTSSDGPVRTNPFVGPGPLETGQPIFGRDRETEELYYLLSAERIVLLHSPSGAGKSSLIRAGLVPRLQQRFDVRGPTRVNTPLPAGRADNRYVRSANLGFEQGLPAALRRDEALVSQMTLAEYVAARPRRRSNPQNLVLIFDQFEEILTADPLATQAKHAFFRQLGELLQDPGIWALFALREDYLAALDPYASQVPTHLKNRFRVDLLSRDAATEAMQGTAQLGGRSFAPDAVAKLVADLATVQVQQPDGTVGQQVGPHVEPLHLQVACRGLWEQMPAADPVIDIADVAAFGDVTQALARYYEGVVGAAGSAERELREWVGDKLITPSGIRGQVLRGANSSEGLDNQRVAQLVDAYLVRAEQRAGAVWYELAHDRLVEPVRRSNATWFDKNLQPMQRQAALWAREGRPDRLLLGARELALARPWADQHAASLLPVERDLLQRSVVRHRTVRVQQGGVGIALAMVVGGAVLFAWQQRGLARQQSQIAAQQRGIAEERRLNVEALKLKVATLEKDKSAAVADTVQVDARLEALRGQHEALKAAVGKLDDERQRVEAAMRVVREDNRQTEAKLALHAAEKPLLEQRRDSLVQTGTRLVREQRDMVSRISALTPVPPMLAVQTQALKRQNDELRAREDMLGRLVAQTEPCDRLEAVAAAPGAEGMAPGAAAAPSLPGRDPPVIPPDPAVSDTLRRRIEELVRQLATLGETRARQQDELAWLQTANGLLEAQRDALAQELTQLQAAALVLQQRQQALRAALAFAEAERLLLNQQITRQEERNAATQTALDESRKRHGELEQQTVDAARWIGSLNSSAERSRSNNRRAVEQLSSAVDRLLRTAADPATAADLAAMLAVKAYRWAPYDVDAAAQPAIYNGLWLALRRLDANAARELLTPGDPAAGKLGTTRSGLLVAALCQRADRPFSEQEWRRSMPEGACFTPEAARACPR